MFRGGGGEEQSRLKAVSTVLFDLQEKEAVSVFACGKYVVYNPT